MKLFTSYFGNIKKLKAAGIEPISIARYSPKWFQGYIFTTVAPTGDMLRDCPRETYIRRYKRILDKTDLGAFLNQIKRYADGRDVALLCYETPGEFCHRHLLAERLNADFGLEITEWQQRLKPLPKKVSVTVDLSLF